MIADLTGPVRDEAMALEGDPAHSVGVKEGVQLVAKKHSVAYHDGEAEVGVHSVLVEEANAEDDEGDLTVVGLFHMVKDGQVSRTKSHTQAVGVDDTLAVHRDLVVGTADLLLLLQVKAIVEDHSTTVSNGAVEDPKDEDEYVVDLQLVGDLLRRRSVVAAGMVVE